MIGAAAVVLFIGLALLLARQSGQITTSGLVTPTKSIASAMPPLRLVIPFDIQYAGEIVASQAKLFESAGLSLNVIRRPEGYDPIAAVVNGDDVFGVVDGPRFLVARSKGAPIVAFGAGYLDSPVAFFSIDSVQIRTLRDFIGKKIVRQPGAESALIYDAVIQNAGLSRSQISEVANGGLEQLMGREIDILPGRIAMMSYELQQRGISFSVLRPGDYGIHVPGTVYFTSEKFARSSPSVVQRFLNAVVAGWRQTYADESASVPLIKTVLGDTTSVDQIRYQLAVQRDLVLPSARRFGEFDELQWKQLRMILVSQRLIDERTNLSGAVDYSFIKETYRKPVTNER